MPTGREWLQELKAGDSVIVGGKVLSVDKVTATQIVVGSKRYNRDDGTERGADSWRGGDTLFEATPERVAQMKELARYRALAYKIDCEFRRTQPIEVLEQVAAILDREKSA